LSPSRAAPSFLTFPGVSKQVSARLRPVKALLWLTLVASPSLAAAPSGVWDCNGKFGLCRYVDRETKQEIIPARFERAMPFSEGLAAVSIRGRIGYIDERGQIVIEPRFDLAGDFVHGLAEILVGDKTGVINRKGEIVVPPMFRRAIPLTSEVIVAAEGTLGPDSYGGFGRLPGFPLSSTHDLKNPGLYHVSGHWVRKAGLDRVSLFDKEGRGLVWASEGHSDLYGLLASNGDWIIQPEYEYAGLLMDDRAIVRKRVDGVLLSGAIDSVGQIVVPLRSWALHYDWKNGLGLARESDRGGKQALLDTNGNIIGGRYFDQVEPAKQGDISKVLIDGRWVGLDRGGNIVPNPDNGRVIASCPNGMRVIAIDGKVQITGAGGQPTAPYLLELLEQHTSCDKPFPVKLNGLWGFVGIDGRLLFDPPAFKNQSGFEGGYAAVFDGQKWGVIDTSGRFVLPAKFDNYLGRAAELFHLAIDSREIWLTATGEERPGPPVTPAPAKILDCGQGLRLIERDGLWGIADADGTSVIAPRYRALGCFGNGISWAAIDSQRQWCPFGPDGQLRDKPACVTAYYLSHPTDSDPEIFAKDPFENSVLWSRAYLDFGGGRRNSPPRWISWWRRTPATPARP
jgi:WG containing repeat